jgi:hypothetical protein
MEKTNPYRIPNAPKVTIREILCWIDRQGGTSSMEGVASKFGITSGDASVRLLKLYRWGYLKREKSTLPPRVYRYWTSRFGKKTARKWRRGV